MSKCDCLGALTPDRLQTMYLNTYGVVWYQLFDSIPGQLWETGPMSGDATLDTSEKAASYN